MFFILPILFLFASCGRPLSNPRIGSVSDGVVVGKINWIEVTKNLRPEIISKTQAVADLFIPSNKTRCTGFLINPETIMTNYHCVPDQKTAVGILANFSHETDSLNKNEFICDHFIFSNEILDYALISCDGIPGEKLGFLSLENNVPDLGSLVYLIHHNCDYFENPSCDWTKKISYGKVLRPSHDLIYNSTDTLLGSSGAPLISVDSGKIVGIHHAGKVTRNNQRGPYNLAIPMEKIIKDLRANAPEVLNW